MEKVEISPCDDSNTANIRSIRNKFYGTIKTIFFEIERPKSEKILL